MGAGQFIQPLLDKVRKNTGSVCAKSLITTLNEGMNSVVLNFIGDSTGDGTTEYPLLFAKKLAEKFPVYNVKYCAYDNANSRYGAWVDAVSNGAERHLTTRMNGETFRMYKADVPWTSADLDIVARFAMPDWNTANKYIMGRAAADGHICWSWYIGASNQFMLFFSPDGTIANQVTVNFTSTSVADNTDGTPYWYRVTLDVDNGAGGYTATVWSSTDGVTWTSLQVITGASTTAVYDDATQPYAIGGAGTTVGSVLDFYEVRICNGINGDNVCPQPIEAWHQSGADYSKGGTINGYPTIYVYNGCVGGQGAISFINDASRTGHIVPFCYNPYIIISLSHNDSYLTDSTHMASFNTLVTNIKSLIAYPLISVMTQSPHGTAAAYRIPHSKRRVNQMAYCLLNNIEVIDAYEYFISDPRGYLALLNEDELHPNALGEAVLANALWDYFNIISR
jgi:lysophospholipase L1-like esterase